MQEQLFIKLQQVFRAVFRNEELVLLPSTSAKDIKMWDSLTHLELIASVEEAFHVQFSFKEVMQFNCVGDMISVINKKVVNNGKPDERS